MRRLLLVILAVGAVAVGCTGDDDDDDDGGTPATVSGVLTGDDGEDPVVGGTISEAGTNNEVTTGSGGVFSITVDADETVFLKGESTGLYPAMRGVVAPAAGLTGVDLNLPPAAQVAAIEGILGVTLDPSKGILAVNWNNTATTAGGFAATISATADGSFTFSSNGTPTMSASTLPNGDNVLVFYNVDAGSTTVTPTVPAGETCTAEYGITSHRVEGETISLAEFDCGP